MAWPGPRRRRSLTPHGAVAGAAGPMPWRRPNRRRSLVPARGLRWRLTLSGAGILILAFSVTSIAVYRGTGSTLRAQIDGELRGEAAAFARRAAVAADPNTATAAATAARSFIDSQPFQASSRLLFETIPGAGTVTNEPEFLGLRREPGESAALQRREDRETGVVLRAGPGFSTVRLHDFGRLRLLVLRVERPGQAAATIGVGEPLALVDSAQDDVAQTLAIAGGLTLMAALIATFLLASRHSRALRRMARTAARIDAGDLSPRVDADEARDEARILALALNRMLDRLADAFARQRSFVSDASHELRTPLTVIAGQLEVLAAESAPAPAEIRRVEGLVRTEVERMTRMVDDLLVLARSEEPAFLHRQELDLAPFVRDLLAGFDRTADRRFELGPVPGGRLSADPDRLAQALRNVLRNAIQHSAPGGLVRISASAAQDGAGWVRFAVEDDGPGIPVEERDRVFDRFHRTDAARSRAQGGSGIGLAIVRAIVEAHGGAVRAGSAASGGARIEIDLPGFAAVLIEFSPCA